MSRLRVFEWHKRFSEGQEEVEDDSHPGHTSTSKTDQNIQKFSEIVRNDRHLSVRMIADMVGINRETVRRILRKKRPNLWKNNVGILHQDNAPAHNVLSVKKFLPLKRIPILQYLSYSWVWHPVTFFCTPKWKVYSREPIFHQLMSWRQKRHSYWTAWGLMSCSTALNNGGREWSGV